MARDNYSYQKFKREQAKKKKKEDKLKRKLEKKNAQSNTDPSQAVTEDVQSQPGTEGSLTQ